MKKISIYFNVLRYGIRNKYTRSHARYKTYPYSKANTIQLEDYLASSPSRDAVVFVGLKQVRHSMGVDDPFDYLNDILAKTFDTLIVPTFTPSVIKTGVFDIRNTPSENGAFSQLFMRQADCRTMSPFKSFCIKSSRAKDIMQLQTMNDYAEGGIFEYLHSNDLVSINVGTVNPRFSTIHFCEYQGKAPYLLPRSVKVNVIGKNGLGAEDMYYYLDNKIKVKFNRNKLEKDLVNAGLITIMVINDLVVRLISERLAFDFMLDRMRKDPYYLVD
ncbi:MAG TPA: AAC(3) family N-acetyltransferase [Candidatus Syntrophosphaera sp.]|nr:AAC(3) family N-acetyltransferase [Candidatus Cloacimonadota bacterium]HOR02700.1 AAC(3) family N-acetyltransferase [Candidatus Syntrophosphaera sp.]